MPWYQSAPIKTHVMNSFCHEIQAVLPKPNVFNPNKNSLGTNGFGLTRFDCTKKHIIHNCCTFSDDDNIVIRGCLGENRQKQTHMRGRGYKNVQLFFIICSKNIVPCVVKSTFPYLVRRGCLL